MKSPPRTIDEVVQYACLIAKDAKRLAGDLEPHHANEPDPHARGSLHRLRQTLLDFSHAMGHIEVRLGELGIIEPPTRN